MIEQSARRPGEIVVLSHFGWGIYRHQLYLLRALKRRGWDVVAAADWSDGYEPKVRKEGFRIASTTLTHRRIDLFADLRLLLHLIALYRREKPDIAQNYHARPMLIGAIAARIAGVPVVVNCVTGLGIVLGGTMSSLRWLFWPLYRIAFGGRVIAAFENKADMARMLELRLVKPERSFHVPGAGLDLDEFRPDPAIGAEDRNIVVMASRMLWSKGVRQFVEAAESLKPRFPNIRFVVAGGLSGEYATNNPDDVDKDWLNAAVSRGTIEWPGHVAPELVDDFYRRAAAVVLPSFYPEGVPRCLIEGAAAGAPIVTTDTPGCRDTVIDGVSGYLCPPRSSEKLAEALAKLLGTPGEIARMSVESRKLAERTFDSRKIAEAFEKIYELAMVGRPPAAS